MSASKKQKITYLEGKAKEVKKTLLTMIHAAQSGHPGGSLSAADIMTVLYFDEMNIDPKNPKMEDRDRFVLSKGHVCPVLYSCLAVKGYFGMEQIMTLRKFGSILQGHPDMKRTPGVDISTGSLGQGFSTAVGMAIASKLDKKDFRVFTLVGDGESQEGQIWEAAASATKYKLDNLVVFIDNNGLQNDGICMDIMPTGDIVAKFRAFGFDAYNIDGHSIEEILDILEKIRTDNNGKPKCIVAKTIKGKGVSFMENVVGWHGKAPNDEEFEKAIAEIDSGVMGGGL